MKTDVVIVGTGVAGLFTAIKLPAHMKIVMITKTSAEDCDSYLAQGGICVKRDDDDFQSFYDDTMKAGHYENDEQSVTLMIEKSRSVINALVKCGVEFNLSEKASKASLRCGVKVSGEVQGDDFLYTKEGAHSKARILYHKDITGKEITEKLLAYVRELPNVTIIENIEMVDIISYNDYCYGIVARKNQEIVKIESNYTILATGGVGGLYENSTNFSHLKGDSLAIALKHNIKLKNPAYVQIHPTSFFTEKEGRRFLITESVRGEGGILLNGKGDRFIDELLPRDVVSKAIFQEMKKEGSKHVWLSLENIPKSMILEHFPNIYNKCLEEGFDITKESVPVVPAQHYYMGGIKVDYNSETSMKNLYAVGETSCNGVHGKNRLASNSLLEALVFAQLAVNNIESDYSDKTVDKIDYFNKGEFPVDDVEIKKELEAIVKGWKEYEE